jgi:copper chaperone CopZ
MTSEKSKTVKSYFDVVGLCCSSEVPLIENILKHLEGVKEVSVVVPSRTVIVVHDNLLISQIQIGKHSQSFFLLRSIFSVSKSPTSFNHLFCIIVTNT